MKTPVVSSVDELIEWRLADIERGPEDMHAYQIEDYEFFKRTPFSIGIIGLGLGKSVIGATLLRDLIYEWEHDGLILIVGPIPIITNSWHDEVRQWRHLVHLGPDMITLREDDDDPRIKQAGKAARMRGEPEGAAMTKMRQQIRHELARSNKSIHMINFEGLEWLIDFWGPRWPYRTVIVDESSLLKDYKSNRFKRLAMVRNTPGMITRMHLLTGTPASESYMGLFAQIYLLDLGDRFGSEVTTFQRRYFYQDRWSQKWKIRPGAEEEILTKIADITTIRDAKDYRHVEDPIVSLRYVHLTDEEMNIYKRMQKEFIVQLPEGSIVEAKNAAALTQKLSQLASGVLYETTIELDMEADDPEDADRIEVKKVHKIHDHKIAEMKEIVKELDGLNVLVAYQHRSSLERLQKAFPKATKWHKSGRDKEAWNAGKINMMLMHPRSGGHGNNLQKGGHVVIFFDIPWSREQFVQLLGRLARQGQTEVVRVIQLVSKGTIDETIARAQRDKRMHEEELYAILQRLIAAARRSHKR